MHYKVKRKVMFTFSNLESTAESKRGLAIPTVTLLLAHLNLTLRSVIAIKVTQLRKRTGLLTGGNRSSHFDLFN